MSLMPMGHWERHCCRSPRRRDGYAEFFGDRFGCDYRFVQCGSQPVNANLTIILSGGDVIENVIGGSGADILTGNSLDNVFTGGSGADTITGGADSIRSSRPGMRISR